jgi:hypothetical protein
MEIWTARGRGRANTLVCGRLVAPSGMMGQGAATRSQVVHSYDVFVRCEAFEE